MNTRKISLPMFLMLFGVILPATIFAAPGDFDTSFGIGGKVLTKMGFSPDYVNAAARQPDGKIVVAGRNGHNPSSLFVARINLDGSLDASFGLNGRAFAPNYSPYSGDAVAIQPDGKIVVGSIQFALVRFNADGTRDSTFGTDGIVRTVFENSPNIALRDIAVQTDGKIVAVGHAHDANNTHFHSFLVARYNVNGSLDASFDADGKMNFDPIMNSIESGARTVSIQPDGKILIGGIGGGGFRVVRLNADGSFDTTFDGDGRATTIIAQYSQIDSLTLQPDGKILAAGTDAGGIARNIVVVRYNADGSLDTTFDVDGIARTPVLNYHNYPVSIALQPDGKIVVGGNRDTDSATNSVFVAVRYNPNGSLDTGFDADGMVITDIPQSVGDVASAVIFQPDGKIVLAGYSINSYFNVIDKISLTRYHTDGSLDVSFDVDGISQINNLDSANQANDIAIQADGKIVAVGDSTGLPAGRSISIARYNANGSLDATFGSGGIVVSNFFPATFSAVGKSVLVQPDGKIVVGGDYSVGSPYPQLDFAIFRYNADGSPDSSFGSSGKIVFPIGFGYDVLNSIALQADGKIIACGSSVESSAGNANSYISVARINANGTLDNSFDADGKLTTVVRGTSNGAYDVAAQTDGKIVVAGSTSNATGTDTDFALVRYNANGTLDVTFDVDGKLTTSFAASGVSDETATGIKIQTDGKIVASGDSNGRFAVARYNSDGSLDNTFDGDGKTTTSVGADGYARDLTIQRNGKIIVAGYSFANSLSDSVLVRYNPNGSPDSSFGAGGVLLTPIGNSNDGFTAIALQTDGKIVAAGSASNGDNPDFSLVRYQGDAVTIVRPLFDFDGDGKSDVSVFRPSTGAWFLNQSSSGFAGIQFGFGTDKIVPADYDGDGKTDVAVYRPSNGVWYLNRSQAGFTGIQFGAAEDVPVPADYDGDGRADLAVFRPSNGVWYVQRSSLGFIGFQFGQTGDKPVAADYDGDGKADYAVFRPANGVWYIERSKDHFISYQFGVASDKLVPADYDGDGKTDVAVYRNGVWYIERSRDHFAFYQFGAGNDVPVPADYDGDGKADLAVFRPSNGVWYLNRSQAGLTGVQFGASEDRPLPSAFVP